jgi:hypothetical protein
VLNKDPFSRDSIGPLRAELMALMPTLAEALVEIEAGIQTIGGINAARLRSLSLLRDFQTARVSKSPSSNSKTFVKAPQGEFGVRIDEQKWTQTGSSSAIRHHQGFGRKRRDDR